MTAVNSLNASAPTDRSAAGRANPVSSPGAALVRGGEKGTTVMTGTPSFDPQAIGAEIEQTRTDLGETDEAPAAKTDLKPRAKRVVYLAARRS